MLLGAAPQTPGGASAWTAGPPLAPGLPGRAVRGLGTTTSILAVPYMLQPPYRVRCCVLISAARRTPAAPFRLTGRECSHYNDLFVRALPRPQVRITPLEAPEMSIRVGINGFGRIGRNVLRAALGDGDIEFAAVNDITSPGTLAHLLQYDSVLGNLSEPVSVEGNRLQVGRRSFSVLSERDPAALPWADLGVDVVVESTGLFTKRADASKHLAAGAKRVIITAPAKSPDLTLVLGVNDDSYDPAEHRIISNASCTTNCLAPVAKVLHDSFGFRRGWMTTVHAYTNDQRLLDLPHKDLRRARAAGVSMIPTTTGAAVAVGEVLPALKGKLDGIAMRVPTPNVSVVDLVAEVDRPATAEAVNEAFATAADGRLKGILYLSSAPLVSIDFRGNPHSSIVDAAYTNVMDGNLVKVLSWYDNEWGYSSRCVDLIKLLARKGL